MSLKSYFGDVENKGHQGLALLTSEAEENINSLSDTYSFDNRFYFCDAIARIVAGIVSDNEAYKANYTTVNKLISVTSFSSHGFATLTHGDEYTSTIEIIAENSNTSLIRNNSLHLLASLCNSSHINLEYSMNEVTPSIRAYTVNLAAYATQFSHFFKTSRDFLKLYPDEITIVNKYLITVSKEIRRRFKDRYPKYVKCLLLTLAYKQGDNYGKGKCAICLEVRVLNWEGRQVVHTDEAIDLATGVIQESFDEGVISDRYTNRVAIDDRAKEVVFDAVDALSVLYSLSRNVWHDDKILTQNIENFINKKRVGI